MNKFEQLIEFVINDEEDKARELFHEIVVEKSRDIYENIMAEEETVEEDAEVVEEDETVEEAVEEDVEAVEEGIEEIDELGGSQADDLIDEIETEEEGISMEAEDDEGDADIEDLEDRVVSVEDKLDELMAEFEELMGADADDEEEMDMGDEEEVEDMDVEFETESLEEGADLTAAPKPVTSEEGSVNKKSAVAANSGAKGAQAKPVSTDTDAETGRPAPKAQDQGGTTVPHEAAAPKATNSEPAGINDKSPIGS